MKLYSEMIAMKYVGRKKYKYYMKQAICPNCQFVITVPIMKKKEYCIPCRQKMKFRWVEIDEPDYTDYLEKGEIKCREVGRKPKKYHS